MIFAICGLTVDGTGTEREGTSSIGDAAVCAAAALNPAIPIATHNSVVAPSSDVTNLRIPATGFFIAFPLFFYWCFNASRRFVCGTLPLQPHRCRIIPE
jgi:hypothetical protein